MPSLRSISGSADPPGIAPIQAITINLTPRGCRDDLLGEVAAALDGAGDLDLIVLPESYLVVDPATTEPVDGPTVGAS